MLLVDDMTTRLDALEEIMQAEEEVKKSSSTS